MAKIVIKGLPTAYNANKSYTFADLHLDLQPQYLLNDNLNQRPEINDLKIDYDIDAIKNSIKNIFFTVPGEKILNPTFGLDLRRFLFDPITRDRATVINRTISNELGNYEPRIIVRGVNVIPDADNDAYQITLVFSIPSLDITNVSLFGVLNREGYSYL